MKWNIHWRWCLKSEDDLNADSRRSNFEIGEIQYYFVSASQSVVFLLCFLLNHLNLKYTTKGRKIYIRRMNNETVATTEYLWSSTFVYVCVRNDLILLFFFSWNCNIRIFSFTRSNLESSFFYNKCFLIFSVVLFVFCASVSSFFISGTSEIKQLLTEIAMNWIFVQILRWFFIFEKRYRLEYSYSVFNLHNRKQQFMLSFG